MKRWLFFLTGLLFIMGCNPGDGGSPIDPNQTDPVVGSKDNIGIPGMLSIEERLLGARVDGADLIVEIPLVKEAGGTLSGTASATLMAMDGETLATEEAAFSLSEAEGSALVTLPTSALPEAGEEEVLYLLRYGVTWDDHELSGVRSLFFSLPKFDLRTRFPTSLFADSPAKVRVFALDPTKNSPLTEVPVALEMRPKLEDGTLGEPVATLNAITDAHGTAVFDVPEAVAGEYAMTASATEGGYVVGEVEDDISVIRTARVLLTTDKPMYKPGQFMDIRALVLSKPALVAAADQQITFEIYDGKGNMVFREYAATNDFGIAATRFKIGGQVNMGDYEIKAIMDETETAKTVPVKYYALPKFNIDATLDKSYYLAGDTMHVVLNTRYFFGKPVAGGQVHAVASAYDIGFTAFAEVNDLTNDEGIVDFEIQLPDYLVGQGIETGNALVTLELTVTDTAEHAETKVLAITVASTPINLVAIPESGELVPGLENTVYVFASNPLGQPVDAAFEVDLGDDDADVNPVGVGIAAFTIVPNDTVTFTVNATDDDASASQTFTFEPGKSSNGLLVRTDRALYRVGETAKVRIFATDTTGRLFLDVIKDGQTAKTDAVDLDGGVAGIDLDLDGSLVGNLIIEAYLITHDAEIIRDKKMIFVRDANGLDITITPNQDQYLPGAEASIEFEVKDISGQPAVAALGVQIVDEAVYALTEMRPGLLETYFLIEEQLQTPAYEIHGASFSFGGIVTSDPDNEEAQTVAGAAFAALDDSQMGGHEISSWGDALAELPAKLQPHYQEHVQQIQAAVMELINHGYWTYEDMGAQLADQKLFYDFWGNLYRFEAPDYWDVHIQSIGPDEIEGTEDDWSARIEVYGYAMSDDGEWDQNGMAGGGGWGEEPTAQADAGAQPPAPGPNEKGEEGEGGDAPRVRKNFPETLYFNPSLITDESGKATVSLTMADSITEWRVTSVANTAFGVLGSTDAGVTVFQDFFVDIDFPATLTRGDEITFPVAIYNYLPITQSVTIELEPGDWFDLLGGGQATVEIDPDQVTVVHFPVKVQTVGWHALTVTGWGTTMNDAIQRLVLVKPDGKEFRDSKSGMLDGDQAVQVGYDDGIIPGSHDLLVKIYPGILAQAVEGLDSLLQMPSGCFEQTTATNWPNTLVLDYLRSSGQVSPEIEMKAVDYLQQGYQRLLTYECTGGGFVWFGDPSPANVVLSAMGVLEFSDMAKVIEIDMNVIERTVDWLVAAQHGDGHWHTDQGSEFATVQYDDVKTTAFAAWAVASSPYGAGAAGSALTWLTPYTTASDTDIYSLAMMANAFATGQPDSGTTTALLNRLADLAVEEDNKVSWTYEGGDQGYYGGGDGTTIEVTALAIQAFMQAGAHLDLVGKALVFLAESKDSFGNYGTTHATILSLRAMIMSLQNKTEEGEGVAEVFVNGVSAGSLAITEENRNVFHQFELGELVDVADLNDVVVSYEGTGNLMYSVVWSWYLPYGGGTTSDSSVLSIDVSYDKTQLQVDDIATATVTVANLTQAQLDMVMVDVGLPPGFTVLTDKLQAMQDAGQIMKYELPGQQVTIYLEKLLPLEELVIEYDLQAKYPVKAQSTGTEAYLYYDEATKDEAEPVEFEVEE